MEPLKHSDPPMVGRYRLLGRLGGGAMGRVYLGRSPGGRPVAVKVIHQSVVGGATFRRRFRREVEAARRVGGFHTAQVVDADVDADPPWIVTAYLPGPSLRDVVHEHGPLPLASVLTLGAGLAEGLSAVHACGLVHRDLKPGNVIVADDGPRIIDFGIAHVVNASRLTVSGAIIGTPAYMPPEQVREEEATGPAGDVFSFGAVLAFAATGRSPFAAGSIAVAVYRLLHEQPDLTGLPDELRDLVSECLAKAPEERPDVTTLIERLAPETGGGDWLPPAVREMVSEHSASLPDAASAISAPGSAPELLSPPEPEAAPEPVALPEPAAGVAEPVAAPESAAALESASPPEPVSLPEPAAARMASPGSVPDQAATEPAMAQPAAVRTAGTLRAVHQPAGDSPLTATTVPPSDAPGRRERRRRRKPGRRGWLLPVSASAAAVLLATAGVVAAIALGQDQAPVQAAPTPTIVSTPTTLSVPTASPTRSAKTRRSAVRPNARSTPPRAKRAIPPGYVLRSALGARLAVPSHYIAKPDGTCHILWEPPGKQDEQIIVCSQESRDAPKGAAARASFWAGRFKSNPILHDVQVTIADVKVNGRAAKALTVIFRGDDGRIWRKQEMYYSGPEGEWKIIIDYEVSTYSERVNQSLFLTAIRTFRV